MNVEIITKAIAVIALLLSAALAAGAAGLRPEWFAQYSDLMPALIDAFGLVGIAVALAAAAHAAARTQRVAAGFVLMLALAQWLGAVLGLNLEQVLPAWLLSTDAAHEGAANTSRGLGLLAATLFALTLRPNFIVSGAAHLLCAAALVLASIDLMGFAFRWDAFFGWYRYIKMPLLSAATLALVAGGSCIVLIHRGWHARLYGQHKDRQIVFAGTGIMLLIAIMAGVVGFSILAGQTERVLSNSLATSLESRSRIFSNAIRTAGQSAAFNAARPHLLRLLAQRQTRRNAGDETQIQEILDIIVKETPVRGVVLHDTAGHVIGARGELIDDTAFTVRLPSAPNSVLLWNETAVVHFVLPLLRDGVRVGEMLLQMTAPEIDGSLTDLSGLGETGAVAVCAPAPEQMQCLPFRGSEGVIKLARHSRGKPLPMSYALDGQTGVIHTIDYRAIEVVAAYAPIAGTGLGMVVKMDKAELYRPIAEQFEWVMVATLFMLVLGALLLRWQVAPLAAQLLAEVQGRSRAEDQLQARRQRLEKHNAALAEWAASKVAGRGELNQSLNYLAEVAARTLEAARVGVWLFDRSREHLVRRVLFGGPASPPLSAEAAPQISSVIHARQYPRYFTALMSDRTLAADRAVEDPRTAEFGAAYFIPLGISSLLDASIYVGGQLVGVVCVEHVGPARRWNIEERNFTSSIADLIALELEANDRRRGELTLQSEKRCFEKMAQGATLSELLLSIVQTLEDQCDAALVGIVFDGEPLPGSGQCIAPNLPLPLKDRIGVLVRNESAATPYNSVLQTAAAITIGDTHAETRWPEYVQLMRDWQIHGVHSVPIVTNGARATGALSVHYRMPFRVGEDDEAISRARQMIEIAIERKRAEAHIEHLAHYDSLTGLPNRAMFNDRLRQALTEAGRDGRLVAVIFLDLDQFKNINDSLGHEVGDRLLQAVAQRLRRCVRRGDTIARLGGDEFTVALADMAQADDAGAIAQKIIAAFSAPFNLQDRELFVTASVGVTIFPDDGRDAEVLLKNADIAMYRAKERGRNNFQSYSPDMNKRALQRLSLETSLRRALERDEFVLHYQPQVDFHDGKISGVEALLRWQHPTLGLVPPSDFIPVAEDTGLIVPIGDWVLHTALAQAKQWRGAGLTGVRMSVNVSGRQLQHRNLSTRVIAAVAAAGLLPEHLTLELTESMLMQNVEQSIAILSELHAAGIALSIDDFGTGYASLSYLKRFPIDVLKVDRSFVQDISTDADDAVIVQAIVTMAHSLGIKSVAEGVETREQIAYLVACNCDAMQGYYFSRPLPADACTALLRSGRRLSPEERGMAQVRYK